MWKLFIYEMKYNKIPFVLLGVTTVFVVLAAAFNLSLSGDGTRLEKIVLSIAFYLATYSTLYLFLNRAIKEHRIRIQMILPVTPLQIGLINAAMLALPLSVLTLLSLAMHELFSTEWEALTGRMISSMGMILVVAAAFLLIRNFYFRFAGKYYYMSGYGLLFSVLAIGAVTALLDIYLYEVFDGLIHFYWGAALIAASVYFMNYRKSYLR